jgi:hypothetical protein
VNLYLQFQARVSNLILKRKPDELSFVLPEKLRKSRSAFRADGPTPLFDVAQM